VALRDQSLRTVAIAHGDTDRSPMTADGQATAGQRVVDAGRFHLDLARDLGPTLAVKVPWNVLLPLSAHRPITSQTLSRRETSQ